MKKVSLFAAFVGVSMVIALPVRAEEPEPAVSLSVGADVVSSYIWRGQELGGFSVQPSATLTFNKANVSLGVWASAELFERTTAVNMTEFDITLAWNPVSAFSLTLCDYYLSGNSYFSGWRWNAQGSHNLELQLAYDFGPLALSWNTCLAGPDHHLTDAGEVKRNYATYVEASAPFTLGGVDCSAAVGASLWHDGVTSVGNEKFNCCNISFTAGKEVCGLPLMGQIVLNPQTDNAYFVVGLTF